MDGDQLEDVDDQRELEEVSELKVDDRRAQRTDGARARETEWLPCPGLLSHPTFSNCAKLEPTCRRELAVNAPNDI